MSPKQTFLDAVSNEIQKLSKAYETFDSLPDSVFEILVKTLPQNEISGLTAVNGFASSFVSTSQNGSVINKHEQGDDDDIDGADDKSDSIEDAGSFRDVIYRIIKDENRGLLKKELIRRFNSLIPADQRTDRSATYALNGLTKREVIKRYSSLGHGRNSYWTLAEWWDGNTLREEHKPKNQSRQLKYG